MTLMNFLRALGRRWYVLLAGLVITGIATGVVASEVQPTYQRSASLLLMPASSSVPEGGNAYLYLGGLGQASEVLVNTMAAQTVREPLLDGHPTADVEVVRNVTSSGPLLAVTATGSSDGEVAEVLERALAAVQSNLRSLQIRADVPEDARISSLPLTTDEVSTVLQRSRMEAVGGTAVAGVALTLLLTGFVDGLLLSSARRRRPTAPDADAHASTDTDLDLDLDSDAHADTDTGAGAGADTDTDTDRDTEASAPSGPPPARHAARRKQLRARAGGPAALADDSDDAADADTDEAGGDRTDEDYARELDELEHDAASLKRGSRATEHVE